jgi:hypothetical protein
LCLNSNIIPDGNAWNSNLHQSSRFTNFCWTCNPVWAAITVLSNFNIMSNLDLVVALPLSDNCRTHCCSINRRTRTDIYIIFNNYIPIWGFLVYVPSGAKPKPSEPIIAQNESCNCYLIVSE